MSVSTDPSTDAPVEVVCTSGDIPFVAEGRLRRFEDGAYTIDLDRDASSLGVGSSAILNFLDGITPRVIAHIASVNGSELTCTQHKVRAREKRVFPRLHGGLPIRYRVAGQGPEAAAQVSAWLSGNETAGDNGDWHTPDEFMNFSVTGLRFDAPDIASEGDSVLIERGVRGREDRWHCSATVVRIFDVAEEERDPETGYAHSLAINFVDIPSEAQEALTEMTLDIQEALI